MSEYGENTTDVEIQILGIFNKLQNTVGSAVRLFSYNIIGFDTISSSASLTSISQSDLNSYSSSSSNLSSSKDKTELNHDDFLPSKICLNLLLNAKNEILSFQLALCFCAIVCLISYTKQTEDNRDNLTRYRIRTNQPTSHLDNTKATGDDKNKENVKKKEIEGEIEGDEDKEGEGDEDKEKGGEGDEDKEKEGEGDKEKEGEEDKEEEGDEDKEKEGEREREIEIVDAWQQQKRQILTDKITENEEIKGTENKIEEILKVESYGVISKRKEVGLNGQQILTDQYQFSCETTSAKVPQTRPDFFKQLDPGTCVRDLYFSVYTSYHPV